MISEGKYTVRSIGAVLVSILGVSLLTPLFAQSPPGLEARRKALNDLLAERWEYGLRTQPIFATILGDKRF